MLTKRVFIPVCTFILGLALIFTVSAFTKQSVVKQDELHVFEFVPPTDSVPYSQANVQNIANWKHTESAERCPEGDVQACKIFVTKGNVVAQDSSYILSPNFVITASEGDVSHVTATSDGTGKDYISNKGS
ncbi:MAG: hypothetical protein QM727_11735 [Niabella sp.]